MAKYNRVYQDPYPGQWEDFPSTASPIYASVMRDVANALTHIEDYLEATTNPLINVESPLYYFSQHNYSTGQTVYTAPTDQNVIALNIEQRHESTSATTASTIETTGHVIVTDTQSKAYTLPNLSGSVTISLIALQEGETITFKNGNNNSHAGQIHAVFEASDDMAARKTFDNLYFESIRDDYKSTYGKVTLDDSKKYFAIACQFSDNTYSQVIGGDIIPNDTEFQNATSYVAIAAGNVTRTSKVILDTNSVNSNYVGDLYAVWELADINV